MINFNRVVLHEFGHAVGFPLERILKLPWIGYRKEFELDKKVIIEFCEFAVKSFENVEDPKPRPA